MPIDEIKIIKELSNSMHNLVVKYLQNNLKSEEVKLNIINDIVISSYMSSLFNLLQRIAIYSDTKNLDDLLERINRLERKVIEAISTDYEFIDNTKKH